MTRLTLGNIVLTLFMVDRTSSNNSVSSSSASIHVPEGVTEEPPPSESSYTDYCLKHDGIGQNYLDFFSADDVPPTGTDPADRKAWTMLIKRMDAEGVTGSDPRLVKWLQAAEIPPSLFRHIIDQIDLEEAAVRRADDLKPSVNEVTLDSDLEAQHVSAGFTATAGADPTTEDLTATILAAQNGQRADYQQQGGSSLTDRYQRLAEIGVYNRPFNQHEPNYEDDGIGYNLNLNWPLSRHILESVQEHYRQNPVTVVLPFAFEDDSAHLNVDYAMDIVGAKNVFAVSAAVHNPISEDNVAATVRGTEARMALQQHVLELVDWKMLYEQCEVRTCLKEDGSFGPPDGTKGLTMLAGVVAALADDKLLGRMLTFHDTDIINPRQYNSLAYLGLPLAHPTVETPRVVYTAKTGEGRNNEGSTVAMNNIARNERISPTVRKAARVAATLVWPLTGERMIHGDDLMNVRWTTGMSIETQMNMHFAGQQVLERSNFLAQVCNPTRKEENGESGPVREFALMDRCQHWGVTLLAFCDKRDILPHQLAVSDIKDFNQKYGGMHTGGFYQSRADNAQTHASLVLDFMLPSVGQMVEMGAVDLDRIRQIL